MSFPHLMFSRKLEVEPNGAMIQSFWRCQKLLAVVLFYRHDAFCGLAWLDSLLVTACRFQARCEELGVQTGPLQSGSESFAQSIQMEMTGLKVLILSLRPYIESFRHGVSNSAMSPWSVFSLLNIPHTYSILPTYRPFCIVCRAEIYHFSWRLKVQISARSHHTVV